jgi:hypothetical protein
VELTNIKRDFQLDAALKRFNDLKGTPEAEAPAAETTEAAAAAPVKDAIVPTEHKKGKVINPEHDIDTARSILDKIAADPNIINRSAADAGKPKSAPAAPTLPAAQPEPAKPAQPAVDPKDLKAGQFMLFKPGPGCEACGGASYQGRMGIYEVLEVDDAVSKMIVGRATSDDIQMAAVRAGMLTMQQDGFVKALQGRTTIEEILRVTRE